MAIKKGAVARPAFFFWVKADARTFRKLKFSEGSIRSAERPSNIRNDMGYGIGLNIAGALLISAISAQPRVQCLHNQVRQDGPRNQGFAIGQALHN